MTEIQSLLILILLATSILFLLIPSVVYMVRRIFFRPSYQPNSKSGISKMLTFSGCLLLSIWCLRYAVGYFEIISLEVSTVGLTWYEEIVNSMVHAFQTFSMDEDYTEYIINGKKMLNEFTTTIPNLSFWYGIYASILNFVAPIAGGALIFEILASVFPKIKLWLSKLAFWREKCYFSELNEASLALAKSELESKHGLFRRPIIVFTDAYLDDEDEKSSERMISAKSMGAICVRDDLAHVTKSRYGKRNYYLIDENEFENIKTLLSLVEGNNIKSVRKAKIYLFVQSDAYVQIEKRIIEEFDSDGVRKIFKNNERPTIIPINGYRNLVHNLFRDIPLYEPLINRTNASELNITIFGNGVIGTEAFLSAYWFGQLMISNKDNKETPLSECALTINVVSKDTKDEFWSKINYINPEIKDTVEVIDSDVATSSNHIPSNDDILICDKTKKRNNPYCKVRYVKSDVKIGGFWNDKSDEIKESLKSDYFIVALGNDSDNISIADRLRCSIGKTHIATTKDASVDNVVIAYAVFDSKLSKTLNKKCYYKYFGNKKSDIFMYAFGDLEQVYSCENVYMSKSVILAEKTGKAYLNVQKHIEDNKKRILAKEDSNYTYWANLARAMHIKYKIFSVGLLEKSIFDFFECEDGIEANEEYAKGQFSLYKDIATLKEFDEASKNVQERYREIERKKHYLAWLEHRRWNAFTRTMGYRFTSDYKRNFELNGVNHKNMELKLHPCLIETRYPLYDDSKTYQNNELKKIFAEYKGENIHGNKKKKLTPEKIWKHMSSEEKVNYLVYKKECCKNRIEELKSIDKRKFDKLDVFSCEWCEFVTPKIIEDIDSAINLIMDNKKVKLKDIIKIGYCDYKQYDYYNCDFD